ncbi:acyl-CoA dehydrogenase family protein [Streptomyces violaceorubidus]|uniref:Acyl-CoA dehydrogenase family protein n=1 Tax=Streptomyces violaceorubidus TaxID=284042 RepID=A0ABV1T5N7_9ACTN
MITVAALERALASDPAWRPEALSDLDEREEFPADAVAALDRAGLPQAYVIAADFDFPRLVQLARTVARRDLTVAIAHGKTFLGAASVWVAGTPEQTRALAARVSAGHPVCWALTERGHGSDLLAGEVTAVPDGDGWRLDGDKWLINNGSRARLGCVLARTGQQGGGRGFSLFLLDRDRLPEQAWRPSPKVRTHGIRGADISGFALRGARVSAAELVGAPGAGVDIVMRALQLTRTVCAGLSLGAADHALALARRSVTASRFRDGPLAGLPYARRVLGRAAAIALTAEAVTVLAGRSAHVLPGELSVASAVTKAFVPTSVQRLLALVTELLGPDQLAGPDGFEKLERDHRICAIFDGNTAVNRTALLAQMPRLGRFMRRGMRDATGLDAVAGPHATRSPLAPGRLTLLSATGCGPVQGLAETVRLVREQGEPLLTGLAERTLVQAETLAADLDGFVPVSGGLPSAAFDLARRYERVYAAAACLLLWLHDPAARGGPLARAALWPRACLAHLLGLTDDPSYEALGAAAAAATQDRFSLLGGGV